MNPAIEQKIEECWQRGDSIKDTMLSVERLFGIRLTFSDIHHRFVELSWRMAA